MRFFLRRGIAFGHDFSVGVSKNSGVCERECVLFEMKIRGRAGKRDRAGKRGGCDRTEKEPAPLSHSLLSSDRADLGFSEISESSELFVALLKQLVDR